MPRSKRSVKKETQKPVEESDSSEEIVIIPRALNFNTPTKSLNSKRKAKHSSDDETSSPIIPAIVIEPQDDEPELPKKKQKVKNCSPSPKRSPRSRTSTPSSKKFLSPTGYSSSEENRSRSRSPSKSPQQKNEEQILIDKIISLSYLLPEHFSPQKIDVWFLKQTLLQLLPEYQKHNHQDIHLPTRKLPLLQMLVTELLHKEKFSDPNILPNKVWLMVFKWLRPVPDLICAKSWFNLIGNNSSLWDEVSLRHLRLDERYRKLLEISDGEQSVEFCLKKYLLYIKSVDLVGMQISSAKWMEDLIMSRLTLLRLPKISKQQVPIVCKIIESSSHMLEEIDLSAININDPAILDSLTNCKNLKKLALPKGCQITLEFVNSLHKLYYIDMIGSSYTALAFKALTKKVVSLAFGFENTGNLGEAVLLGNSSNRVKHLRIKSNNFKDGEIYYVLKRMPELESLTLENASKMTEKGFRKIAKYGKNLGKLAIHTGKINDRVINLICNNCTKLRVFILEKANVTDAGIIPPLLLPELQYFALVNCQNVSPEGIANFKFVEEETKKHQLKPIKALFTNKLLEDTDFFDPITFSVVMEESTTASDEELETVDSSEFVLSDDEKKK